MLFPARPALRHAALPTLSLGLLTLAGVAHGASLMGRVTLADGQPVAGALVTVFNEAKDRKETVYTAQDGSYAIHSSFSGKLTVRARSHRLEDISKPLVSTSDTPTTLDFQMKLFQNAQALSDSLHTRTFAIN